MKEKNTPNQILEIETDLKEIDETYKKAKFLLKEVNEMIIVGNETEEKAAVTIKNEVSPLSEKLFDFYNKYPYAFKRRLKAVNISLEFINEHPFNEEIFKCELKKLEDCLEICNDILKDSNDESFRQEAENLKGIINNSHLPSLYCYYAISYHEKIRTDVLINKKTENAFFLTCINNYKKDIENLNNCLSQYQNIETDDYVIDWEIKTRIAQSYEDLADYQYDYLLPSAQSKESIELIREIKSNYEKSFELYNNHSVWLSILNCHYLLVEHYGNVTDCLRELDEIIQLISKKELSYETQSTDEGLPDVYETLSSMFYAYNKAYELTKNEDYKAKAREFLDKNYQLIAPLLSADQFAVSYNEITIYLKHLGLFGQALVIDLPVPTKPRTKSLSTSAEKINPSSQNHRTTPHYNNKNNQLYFSPSKNQQSEGSRKNAEQRENKRKRSEDGENSPSKIAKHF